MSWENVADENEYLTFWQPKRPFLCSDLWKESSSVDKNQLQNISCYIFLQLDNAMIYMLYRKSWLKWRVKSGSVEFTLRTLLKVLAVPKSLQSWLKTNKRLWKHCLVCYTKIPKNTGILFSKIPVSVFEWNPGIPVFSGIPQGPAGDFFCRISRRVL